MSAVRDRTKAGLQAGLVVLNECEADLMHGYAGGRVLAVVYPVTSGAHWDTLLCAPAVTGLHEELTRPDWSSPMTAALPHRLPLSCDRQLSCRFAFYRLPKQRAGLRPLQATATQLHMPSERGGRSKRPRSADGEGQTGACNARTLDARFKKLAGGLHLPAPARVVAGSLLLRHWSQDRWPLTALRPSASSPCDHTVHPGGQRQQIGLLSLPQKAQEQVFFQLDLPSAQRLASTCHHFRTLWHEEQEILWEDAAPLSGGFWTWRRQKAKDAAETLLQRLATEVMLRRMKDGSEVLHYRSSLILGAPALQFITKQDDLQFLARVGTNFGEYLACRLRQEHDPMSDVPEVLSLVVSHYRPEALSEGCMQRLELLLAEVPANLEVMYGSNLCVEANFWVRLPSGQKTPVWWRTIDGQVFHQRDQLCSLGVL